MTLIAELDHQRNPKAIAEIIRQELNSLNLDQISVEAEIIDSNLDLQIRTNSAIDKEKLLTLIHSELQNLHIESLTKFRIHCWRNSEIEEPRLLWSEQLMLQSLKLSPQPLSPDTNSQRLPEPQLSKNSVLQAAINQISSTNPQMQQHLLALQQEASVGNGAVPNQSLASDHPIEANHYLAFKGNSRSSNLSPEIDHSYWHLVLVGLSIVLFGLGIGAVVRTLTARNAVTDITITSSPVINPPPAIAPQSTALLTPLPSISPTNNPSSSVALVESSNIVTLDKFNLVENGMTIEQVEQIFGVTGKVIAETTSGETVGKVYSWRNPEGSNAIIEFKNGQVVAKAQAGL